MNLEKIKQNKTTEELLEFGIFNIDKPSGPTSFTVSEFVCKKLKLNKTSHFGTLDPKVTGVLPIALNRGCKLTGFFLGEDKEYVGILRAHEDLEIENIQKVIDKNFLGKIKQTPPVKSRVKREEREREVKKFKILEKDGKDFLFETEVEGGTYIRKLIDDLGKEMGIGMHMLELRRIRAGIFDEGEKFPLVNLYDFEKAVDEYENGNDKKLREVLIPGEIVSELFDVVEIKKESLKQIFTGKPIYKKDLSKKQSLEKNQKIVVFCGEKFVGIYKVINTNEILAKPEFVLQPIK